MATRDPLADALETEGSGGQGPVPNKRIKIEAAATELVGGSTTDAEEKQQRETAAAAGEGSNALPVASTLKPQPLPASTRRRRISKPAVKDPREYLPTVVKPEDPDTAQNVASSRDKALVRDVARSTVSVSSIALDGKVIEQQTGIVIGWKETQKCARILTSSDIVDGLDPTCKLHIGLPNRTILEGQLLFFNKHYDIALLEISSESDLPLKLPTFGSNPKYGQDVFMLARGKDCNLIARHGTILWLDKPKYPERNYYMYLAYGTGGPVIDHDGNVTGMAFDFGDPNTSIIAISIIVTCIEMWMKFSRIARPVHGLRLRTVELLEVSLQEVISLDHNINNGYIVDKVSIGSTADKLGIRYGDVIVSFDGLRDQTLPQLEDYLLSLGWGFLQGSTNSSSTVDLKLEVYVLLERRTRSVTLSVEFCDASE
ncbi:unnamed protein product [Urochloa decumbens]|uniref:PDZ domain-containing protein n=1 Tax=Urochloa decumbens TaxID=240449 RepID=A0ABC9D0G4_9POAL